MEDAHGLADEEGGRGGLVPHVRGEEPSVYADPLVPFLSAARRCLPLILPAPPRPIPQCPTQGPGGAHGPGVGLHEEFAAGVEQQPVRHPARELAEEDAVGGCEELPEAPSQGRGAAAGPLVEQPQEGAPPDVALGHPPHQRVELRQERLELAELRAQGAQRQDRARAQQPARLALHRQDGGPVRPQDLLQPPGQGPPVEGPRGGGRPGARERLRARPAGQLAAVEPQGGEALQQSRLGGAQGGPPQLPPAAHRTRLRRSEPDLSAGTLGVSKS